jgi:ribosome-associated toxin RatA of RatAB toxin-antitoxin module
MFSERYTSRVTLFPHHSVQSVALDSPTFKSLMSSWQFHEVPGKPNFCHVDFMIEFEANSSIKAYAANKFFGQVSRLEVKGIATRGIQFVHVDVCVLLT